MKDCFLSVFQPVIRSPARFALFCLVAAMAMLSVAQAIPAQGAVRVRHRPALVVASAESHLEPVQDAVFFRPFMQESGCRSRTGPGMVV